MQNSLVVVNEKLCENDPAATSMVFGELSYIIIKRRYLIGPSKPIPLNDVLRLESTFYESVSGVVSKYGRKLVRGEPKINFSDIRIAGVTHSFDEARCAMKRGFVLGDSDFPFRTEDGAVSGFTSYRTRVPGAAYAGGSPCNIRFSIMPKFNRKHNLEEFLALSDVIDSMKKLK